MVRIYSVTTMNINFSLVYDVKKFAAQSLYFRMCYTDLWLQVGASGIIAAIAWQRQDGEEV
jgi:hypothetical protein